MISYFWGNEKFLKSKKVKKVRLSYFAKFKNQMIRLFWVK
jgi:hypothetical protein